MSRITGGFPSMITGTIGTVAVNVMPKLVAREYLRVHNPNNTSFLAASYDGKTSPVVNGQGFTIAPLSTDDFDIFVPTAGVMLISDTINANFTLMYM